MFGSLWRAVAFTSALAVIAVVIWIDVTTPVWQNLVIVSGLVAGVVTFLFTTLFIDRFIQRAARRRWAPVWLSRRCSASWLTRSEVVQVSGLPSRVDSPSRMRRTGRMRCWRGPRSCAGPSCANAVASPPRW